VLLICAAMMGVTAWVLGDLLSGFTIKDPAAATYELLAWAIAPWAAALTAWVMATLVGVTNALPMQVGVARVMYAMGRDRQLPAVLAKIHPKHGTPYVGMAATSVISVSVSLLMRNQMDELVSIVNFGALSGFLLLHVSVIAQFWVRGRSGRWIVHLLIPVAGIIVVLAVLSGMSPLAMALGTAWLIAGIVWGVVLVNRRRAELAI
jgi:amino acid transporter